VARAAHFVSAAEAGEEELIARVDGLIGGVHAAAQA
jgi:hypothetical protein